MLRQISAVLLAGLARRLRQWAGVAAHWAERAGGETDTSAGPAPDPAANSVPAHWLAHLRAHAPHLLDAQGRPVAGEWMGIGGQAAGPDRARGGSDGADRSREAAVPAAAANIPAGRSAETEPVAPRRLWPADAARAVVRFPQAAPQGPSVPRATAVEIEPARSAPELAGARSEPAEDAVREPAPAQGGDPGETVPTAEADPPPPDASFTDASLPTASLPTASLPIASLPTAASPTYHPPDGWHKSGMSRAHQTLLRSQPAHQSGPVDVDDPAPNVFERDWSGDGRSRVSASGGKPPAGGARAEQTPDGARGPLSHRAAQALRTEPAGAASSSTSPPTPQPARAALPTPPMPTRPIPDAADGEDGVGAAAQGQPWPPLPEDDPEMESTATDLETTLRSWRRRQRLDREQRGEPWNGWLF